MGRSMWMGPRGGEVWVPQAATGMEAGPSGWQTSTAFLNGGIATKSSVASHMEYNIVWNKASRDALRPVMDMYHGVRGPGLIYLVDPVAADKNALPIAWSFPAQAGYDAMPLLEDARPVILPTPDNALGYPAESARYSITPSSVVQTLYLPIPPGYTAWVGAHGETSGPQMVARPVMRGNAILDPVRLPMLSVTDPNRFSNSFSSASYQGIELSLASSSGVGNLYPSPDLYPSPSAYPSSGIGELVILSGLMVQILPIGTTPAQGGFISGQGHSGLAFEKAPSMTVYSINNPGAEVGMSAKMIETGQWL